LRAELSDSLRLGGIKREKRKEAARAPPPSKREKLPTIAVCRFVKLRIEAFGDKPTTEQVTSTSGSFVHAFQFLPGPLFRSGDHFPIEQRACHTGVAVRG
jgi:hypothetical protein